VPNERLMLLDGNGLIYRGYFALPPLTTSKGELVNAVFGFCSIVLRGIQDLKPDYVAVAFDLQGPTFRHEQYAEYKATRQRMPDDLRDQFPKVREVVKALRIPVYEMAGYEADDVIGTITQQLDPREDLETTIVTVDLDMLQLVTPRVRLMTTRSGVENTVIYDVARIEEILARTEGIDSCNAVGGMGLLTNSYNSNYASFFCRLDLGCDACVAGSALTVPADGTAYCNHGQGSEPYTVGSQTHQLDRVCRRTDTAISPKLDFFAQARLGQGTMGFHNTDLCGKPHIAK
jgi:hypothetical protein